MYHGEAALLIYIHIFNARTENNCAVITRMTSFIITSISTSNLPPLMNIDETGLPFALLRVGNCSVNR
jgi:hypothetical protein